LDQVYVSSSICSLASPAALLSDWEDRCRGEEVAGLCLDPRLGHELQHDVLVQCRQRGLACPEIGHPLVDQAPSAISQDRDERSAAGKQLLASGRRAHEFGVQRLLAPPWALALKPSLGHVVERFQRDLDPGLAGLQEGRSIIAERALDACCLVLDPVLRELEDLGVEVVLLHPTAWPHQFPDAEELARLGHIFDGAPLGSCLAVDWWHVAQHFQRTKVPEGAGVSRIADASGMTGMLPVGTGELDWDAVAPALRTTEVGVVTYDAALCPTPRELAAGLTLLQKVLATPD
jgi:hypothetical protein